MSFDQWMNVCGISGVCIYLTAWWWYIRIGVGDSFVANFMNRLMRTTGFLLILTPLFLRWYLSSSLILFGALAIMMIGCFILYKQRSSS